MYRCPECGGTAFRVYAAESIRSFIDFADEAPEFVEGDRDFDGVVNQVTCENPECDTDLDTDDIVAFCTMHGLQPFYDHHGPMSIGPNPGSKPGSFEQMQTALMNLVNAIKCSPRCELDTDAWTDAVQALGWPADVECNNGD